MKTFERRENFRLAAITLFRASIVIMLLVTAVDVYTEISKGDGWTD